MPAMERKCAQMTYLCTFMQIVPMRLVHMHRGRGGGGGAHVHAVESIEIMGGILASQPWQVGAGTPPTFAASSNFVFVLLMYMA